MRITARTVGTAASSRPTMVSGSTPTPETMTPRNMAMEMTAGTTPPSEGAEKSSTWTSTSCCPMRREMTSAAWSSSWLLAGEIPTFSLR